VGGIPEIVGEEAGVLVPAANPTALAAAIRALADDAPQQRQVGEARLRALYDEVLAAAEAPTLSAATARAGGTPPAGRNIAPTR
jgi:glycosyltransferase involved in cell wall biosynthesis